MLLDPFNRLAKILRVKPEALLKLESKMASITGQEGVIERIIEENDILIERTLSELGLSKEKVKAPELLDALQARLIHLDEELYEVLGRPDLSDMSKLCGKLCELSLGLVNSKTGFFIKKEKAVELLENYPPQNTLDFFGYKNVRELVDKESFESVFASLRFTQSTEWMHNFFDQAYNSLMPEDFEEREIELKVLEEKWLNVAEAFLEKKYHNVSHLKELGIVFIIPLKLDPIRGKDSLRAPYEAADVFRVLLRSGRALAASNGAGTPGEILRIFTLILHYLNEVPFYSRLFRRFFQERFFIENLKSLLRGDVLKEKLPDRGKMTWRIVQRYLAKDDPNDFRLFEPHVNPEAEHWYKAEESLGMISLKDEDSAKGLSFGFWKGLDYVGDYFGNNNGEELVSFNLIDLVMTLVKRAQIKYLYHQQEALWNKLFIEYLGRDRMNELIEENIIKGYIEL